MRAPVLKPVLAVYTGLFLLFLYGPLLVLGHPVVPVGAGRRAAVPDRRMVDLLVPRPVRPEPALAHRAAADPATA